MRSLVELIAKKREGQEHKEGEIRRLIDALMAGELADYQMSAWLMAAFLRGLSDAETNELTDAMLRSGEVLDLSSVPGIKVDKHSTGGVGDKVSLCLAPMVAACGVPVPMISGRGLGHTGGTLDKLEAIPGFRVDLSTEDFIKTVREVGVSMIGQTAQIAPADKKIYALRDVTATVECIPLIVASILSKKLAEGIDALVLDVKVGRGAFMKDVDRARELAEALVRVGTRAGKRVVALLTDMSVPLGCTIGNALETREAIEVLHGRGPDDLVACTLALGAEMLVLGGKARDVGQGEELLRKAITDGRAAGVMRSLIKAHQGDPRVVDEPDRLPRAPIHLDVHADRAGWVTGIDPRELGLSAVALGAGRTRADQSVDHDVGLELLVRCGDKVKKGTPLVRIHARSRAAAKDMEPRVRASFTLADTSFPAPPLVLGRVDASSLTS
ncbi:MAG: thymidine phosphorylase [Myxococcales bacterium]|nr:thymidine phosphorylase [Polyangiaceae bacterium]MDW8251612.1 thymidine phosphorylase [Myxococcales bacterium]